MNKGIIFCTSALLLFTIAGSCKRSHMCYCKVSGTFDTTLIKEYRGYSKREARQLCESDELVSTQAVNIECDIHR
ncbi:MAG TPA: hypothetical protein VEB40_16125 [Flavipsychrobacter sp.]|nr:hypothetical protein [Flavipsychrobacter sp.]